MEMEERGTWEELILVSAVLRHGTGNWDTVVSELRARTFAPGRFTPEVCKEKYEDLQQRYSTCSDLLEELRMQRIAELRRTLEKSDGSIGFLQTKLQYLKAEKEHSSSVDYQSSPFESPAQTSVGQLSGKETSKDGLSAGSFTQEISKICSPPLHVPAVQTKPQTAGSSKPDTAPIAEDLVKSIQVKWGTGVKKKRGKRKRRGCCQDIKEENVDEAFLDSAKLNLPLLARIKVEPTSECILASPPLLMNSFSQGTDGPKCNELTRIFDMISCNEYASIFRRKLDSQKRARYRMIVRQHMDLDAIKSRIEKQAITSTKELLRDLLLLATNAALFYSRNTREHRYAVALRGIVKRIVMECKKNSIPALVSTSPTSPATALQMANPANHKSPEKLSKDENIGSRDSEGAKKSSKPKDSHLTKTSSQARKVNRGKDGSKVARHKPPAKLPYLNARIAKDGSRPQQPQVKLAHVNAHSSKDGSKQQPQAKLAYVNAENGKDGSSRPQPQAKLACVNDSKARKKARNL